jgi:citrate lyase beta subunit
MGLKEDCQHAFSLGMKAKAAIHPNQLETINQVFSPTQKSIDWAKGLLEMAENTGKGVFQYQGKMIDKPVIEKAKKIIKIANDFNLL